MFTTPMLGGPKLADASEVREALYFGALGDGPVMRDLKRGIADRLKNQPLVVFSDFSCAGERAAVEVGGKHRLPLETMLGHAVRAAQDVLPKPTADLVERYFGLTKTVIAYGNLASWQAENY